jgi:RNA recognition motif-containing protein
LSLASVIDNSALIAFFSLTSASQHLNIKKSVMNIYVSNLSFNTQDEDLKKLFTPYGEVSSAKVINDKITGQSKGFGFVEMANDEAAKKAIEELNNGTIDGRSVKVMEARPREDRDQGRNNSGGYRKNKW